MFIIRFPCSCLCVSLFKLIMALAAIILYVSNIEIVLSSSTGTVPPNFSSKNKSLFAGRPAR